MNGLIGLLRSILIVSLISSIFAFVFEDFGMFRVFGVITITQILGYMGYNTLIGYLRRAEILKEMDILSKQGIEVICPCPKGEVAFIPVDLNKKNTYVCECGKKCGVDIQSTTFLVTTPIDLDNSQQNMVEAFDDLTKKYGPQKAPVTVDEKFIEDN